MTEIPLPLFNQQPNVHLTKKACIEAGLPLKASVVPKSPVKKSLTVSSYSDRAISVSFIEPSVSYLSIIYDPTCDKTYFEQCFYDIKLIGEGSFGVVFSVRFREDNQLYAIKKSKSPFYSNNDKRTKLEEVRKHEMIPKHPNCVQLYGSWVEDNFLYIQMELCDTSLEHYASRNHNISEEMLWNILADMLLAVKNLHDNNLIHLDIKLENILMCSSGTCKLADFGLVSDVNKIKGDTLEGDQKYLAPELLSGHFTKAADIFSLGIVMLELSCDLLLPSNGILWQQLRNDTLPDTYIQNIPHQLLDITKQMMSSNYLSRPTVDELLKCERIQNLLAARKVSSHSRLVVLHHRYSKTNLLATLVNVQPTVINLCDTCSTPVYTIKDTPKVINPTVINLCETCGIGSTSVYTIETPREVLNITETKSPKNMGLASSTPSNNQPSTKWSLNINISPIRNDMDMNPQPWGSFICQRKKNQELVIPSTPRSVTRKSRLNSVGRRLF